MSGQSHLPVPEAKGKARSPGGPCSGQRIYLRQRSLKANGESDILKRFHSLLVDYFTQGLQHEKGLPTVAYCADKLAYSARYFGDLKFAYDDSFQSNKEAGRYLEDTSRHRALVFK